MVPDGPHCHDCPHKREGARFVPSSGSGSSGLLLVGDSPWRDETREGRPFAGAAGRTLDRWFALLSAGGLRREDVTIWNTIQCSPQYLGWMDKPAPEAVVAIEHCRPNLDSLIAGRKPRVIVPMGNVALRRICGLSGIDNVVGYVLPTPYGIPAVPCYHPSYIMRGKSKLTPTVLWALTRAMQIAGGTYKESKYELLVDPSPKDLIDYYRSGIVDGRIRSMFCDIETLDSGNLDEEERDGEGLSFTILRCGFSVRPGTAVSFPWAAPYTDIMREALGYADEFVEWADNSFDSRRLRAAGQPVPHRVVSAMWAWHWLQSDLPKGLGKVAPFWYGGPPWKHLSQADPGRYNALDCAIGLDCWTGTKLSLIGA